MCNFVLLGAHRYHNAGEAAWLIEPLDDRFLRISRRLSNLAVEDQTNYSQDQKSLFAIKYFLIQIHLQQPDVSFTQVDEK